MNASYHFEAVPAKSDLPHPGSIFLSIHFLTWVGNFCRKRPVIRAISIVAAIFAALGLTACDQGDRADAESVRSVLYIVAEAKPDTQTGFAGTIEARYSTDLAFRVLGRIVSRPVQVGDRVQKGEMVAMIDPSTFDLAVQSAHADLASAQAQYTNAQSNEERQHILLRGKNVSQADYDAAKQVLASASAGLEKARARLKSAEDQRSYTTLHPDFDGVISATNAEVGQVVATGQTVLTVARPDIREAVLDIPDSLTQYLTPGTPFSVQLQADPSVTGKGKVREVAPQADAQTRSRRVRIALDKTPDGLRLGATIRAEMVLPQQNLVTIPIQALLEEKGKTSIWIIEPRTMTASLHEVQVIEKRGNRFVAGGVNVGAFVAIAGVHELKEGQKVRLNQKGIGL